jgi:5'(3')-deoxyribonucleotidase
MTIYLDMDDVVSDFKGYAKRVLKKNDVIQGRLPDPEWNKLKDNPHLYADLKVKEGAEDLVRWCELYCLNNHIPLYFLTAIPRNNDFPWAIYDKVNWARKHFRGIPVFFGPYSQDKWRHCKPGDILIDDRGSNCREWEEAGGLACQYRNWPQGHEWLVTHTKPFAFIS